MPRPPSIGGVEISGCSLDQAGVRDQRARYARVAASVTSLVREEEALLVEFGPDLDRATLEEALAVERECCPFFRLAFDQSQRRLRVAVEGREHLPALDAIAHSLCA